jgi:hypothetical protein
MENKEDLLIAAYNLMSDMGFGDDEIEEISEEFNDDLNKVYKLLKSEVSSHYSDELFDRYEALLALMKHHIN